MCFLLWKKKKGLTTWQQPLRISWERIIIIRIQIKKKISKKSQQYYSSSHASSFIRAVSVSSFSSVLLEVFLLRLFLPFLLCSLKFFCSGHRNCFFNLIIWELNLIIYFLWWYYSVKKHPNIRLILNFTKTNLVLLLVKK